MIGLTLDVGKHITAKIFGVSVDIDIIWSTLIVTFLLAVFMVVLAKKLRARNPSKIQVAIEELYNYLKELLGDDSRPGARSIVTMAFVLALFVLLANWLELIPSGHNPEYLPSPSSSASFTLGLSFSVVIYVQILAIRARGLKGYLAHFFKPFKALFPINMLEEFIKAVTLGYRLFGNIFAGSLLLALLGALPFYLPTFIGDIVWRSVDFFVGLIQAFIFMLLTIVYYNIAVGSPDENH